MCFEVTRNNLKQVQIYIRLCAKRVNLHLFIYI